MLKGLRTVAYPVTDLSGARDWYARTTGVAPYFDQPFYVGFSIGGFELGLLPADGRLTVVGEVHALWGVENIHEAYATLLRDGATAHTPPQEVGDGIVCAAVRDPFGNLLGLIFNPHFNPAAVS
ncbi:MAG: glyoxalase/bleomycin resistance/extradiol dioxygenase family protein [Opitutus sp.]|nr:glyoxalase/bleomycin resistance/extradiol dioxygenase family protein [Opitutus sp.]